MKSTILRVLICGAAALLATPLCAAPTKLPPKLPTRKGAPGALPRESLPYVPPLPLAPLESSITTLSSGLTLAARPDRTAPRVALSLLIKAGAADENARTSGWRRLLADAMLRGSKDAAGAAQSATEVQRAAENLGGTSGASVGDDHIEFWAVGDSAQQAALLDLVLQMALRPRLSDDDIEAVRERLLTRLDAESLDVPAQAINALRERLYRNETGAPAVYGLPTNGREAALKALTPEKVRHLHQLFFQPEQMTLAAAGDVDVPALRARLEALQKSEAVAADESLPRPGAAPRLVPPAKEQPPLVVRQLPMQGATPAAWLFVGYAGPGADSADAPALRVLSAALGEMPRSRLEKRLLSAHLIPGLDDNGALQAASQWTPRRYSGEIVAFAQTKAENIEDVKNALLDEVSKLRDGTLALPELERAKNYASGGWATEREGLRDRAFQTALAPASGAPADAQWPERIAAVNAADVHRVAQKYLQNYAVTLVMPED